jgi:hypothetical protein
MEQVVVEVVEDAEASASGAIAEQRRDQRADERVHAERSMAGVPAVAGQPVGALESGAALGASDPRVPPTREQGHVGTPEIVEIQRRHTVPDGVQPAALVLARVTDGRCPRHDLDANEARRSTYIPTR